VHTHPRVRLDLWSLSLVPSLAAAHRSTAPPRPRRGRVLRARGRKGERRSLGHLVHALPPAGPRTHTLVPTVDAMPAATYGAGPGSTASPAATPLLRPTTSLAVSITLHARFLAHTIAHAFTRLCTGEGHQHRRRADVATHTPATTSPRQPPPLVLRPFEPSNPRGFLEVIPFWPVAQAPWSSPLARSSRAAVPLLGISSST
jgi:transposase InsO family protein